jgi:hypothetical protein
VNESIAISVARALETQLAVFVAIGDQPLQAIRYDYFEEDGRSNENMLERIWLDFQHGSLEISAEPDDDTVNIVYLAQRSDRASGIDATPADPWQPLIGKRFGWGWVIVNQQGYCDGAMLSFDGIRPGVLLTVVASALKVSAINELGDPLK